MVAAFGTAPNTLVETVPQVEFRKELTTNPTLLSDQDTAHDYFIREERVRRGDTASTLMDRLGIASDSSLQQFQSTLELRSFFRQLSPGKTVTAKTDGDGKLIALSFALGPTPNSFMVLERLGGKLHVTEQAMAIEPEIQIKSGRIHYSLFQATDAAGIPDSIAGKFADIFGSDVDFHRDLRDGDRFSVVYESFSYLGRPIRTERILAAEFINNGKSYKAVWFSGPHGGGYYTPEGKSLQKTFLRSPLEFSRVTSGFTTARFHPVLQQWRAHRGVDYGASVGTRVRATADGVVEFAGTQGGYGNLVILRHQGRYSTVYGHLSRFTQGLRAGSRVSQGDIIAYSGATGLASGPHLHYEFRVDGVFKNPLTVALPGTPPLPPAQMAQFEIQASSHLDKLDLVRATRTLASLD